MPRESVGHSLGLHAHGHLALCHYQRFQHNPVTAAAIIRAFDWHGRIRAGPVLISRGAGALPSVRAPLRGAHRAPARRGMARPHSPETARIIAYAILIVTAVCGRRAGQGLWVCGRWRAPVSYWRAGLWACTT